MTLHRSGALFSLCIKPMFPICFVLLQPSLDFSISSFTCCISSSSFFFPLMTITFLFYNLHFIHLSSHILERCLILQTVGDYLIYLFTFYQFSVIVHLVIPSFLRPPFLSLLFCLLWQTAHLFLLVPLSTLSS